MCFIFISGKYKNMKKLITTLLLLFVMSANVIFAQKPIYEVKSMIIYNIIKYVDFGTKKAEPEFKIGVFGNDDVYNTLHTWYNGKEKGHQKMKVIKLTSMNDLTDDFSLVYFNTQKSLDYFNRNFKNKQILSVTDKPNFAKKGAGINIIQVNNKIKFEINLKDINLRNIKVSNQFVSLCIKV